MFSAGAFLFFEAGGGTFGASTIMTSSSASAAGAAAATFWGQFSRQNNCTVLEISGKILTLAGFAAAGAGSFPRMLKVTPSSSNSALYTSDSAVVDRGEGSCTISHL